MDGNSSDDDYDHVSDVDLYASDCESAPMPQESTPSSPPSIRDLKASDRKTLACTYNGCPKTFNRRARLDEHIRSHQNIRLFKCPEFPCTKDFLRQSHLNHHVKSAHTDIRDYKCTWDGCNKSFATGTRLRRHLQAHEGREKYRCRGYTGCNETFRKHETLKKHILSVHEQVRPYPCLQLNVKTGQPCTKAFETGEKLDRHQRTQHDTMRFSCTDCLALIQLSGETADPVDNNSGVPVTSKDVFFATYLDLQAHITEVHPPTCQYCPTSFKTAKELSRHLEVQHDKIDPNASGEKSFLCAFPDCNRSFTKRGNLNVHIKSVHEKKKDFVCGVTLIPIPEEFIGRTDVRLHGCGRAFTTKASLQDHVRTAHLGLQSKLLQERHKRKAEQSMDGESDSCYYNSKKRAPRKDKGIPRMSAFAGLIGLPAATEEQKALNHQDFVHPVHSLQEVHERAPQDSESDEEIDDCNQLSGSMTLLGDRMFHNGREYHYDDVEDHVGEKDHPIKGWRRNKMGILDPAYNFIQAFEDDLIFDNFEHEPELLDGLVDPVLLQPQQSSTS